MKRFSFHIISILIITAICSLILDYEYTYFFEKGTPRNKVQLVNHLQNEHIDFIFLGSSRVENHIDCDLIKQLTGSSCLNLGLQGSRIKDAKALALLLEANNVTYNKLFVQVDYIYNFHNYSPSFIAMLAPYIKKENFPKALKDDLELSRMYDVPFMRYAFNDKVSGFREVVLQIFGKKPKVDLTNGYIPIQKNGKEVRGKFPNEVVPKNKDLEGLLAINNKITLFTAPYCQNTSNRDYFMKGLTDRYPNLLDYIAIFDKSEQYFANCGHLNEEGSQKFTEILTNDILLK